MDEPCFETASRPDARAWQARPGLGRRPRPAALRRTGRRAVALPVALALLASCQGYAPRPLDPAAHHEAWNARALEASAVRELLAQLDLDARGQGGAFDPADGLSLKEGRLLALVYNPSLRLARLRAARAAAGAEHAGLWTDPELSLDVLRITESVPDPWVVTPGLAFTIPLSGRVAAERGLADATLRAARAEVLEAEWSIGYDLERAWIEWSAVGLRVQETERLVESMEGLVRTVSQLAERGELSRAEAALFALEQAQHRNGLRRLRGERAAGEQRLRALLGLAPEAPVELLPTLARPGTRSSETASDAGAAASRARLEARNPRLARLRQEYDVSEETLRRELAKRVPDLTLGPLFEADEGQSRVGFLGALPLPLWNANRRSIAEARIDRELARAVLETELEALVGRWAAVAARAEALLDQSTEMEQVLVPLVERQLEDAFELMRLGEGTSLVLFESLTRAHQTKLELIETRTAEVLARAELAYYLGPEAVREPSSTTEEKP